MTDLGTGSNGRINWSLQDKQEMIVTVEIIYHGLGAGKGRGLVVIAKKLFS